ncbi:DNA polymerase I, partial [Candidatus Kaiserbacteria bacterium]|nr:DNA polymerase I [Candidatus Kaiserbacteria bacterium]
MAKKDNKGRKRLVLLDAHAIIHRAYHALPEFTSSKGEPTGGLYGLSSMLIKLIDELKPDYLVACFDLPGPTHRHDVYEEYKAKRLKAEDALVAQLKRARDVFTAFGIPIIDSPGFEADDCLGTLVQKFADRDDIEIIIASGDMDTLQLVDDDRVKVFTFRKGLSDTVTYDEKKVRERFGFGPEVLPDYKGLRGDPSDNIKGVKGIGEKAATDLLLAFGSMKGIYDTLAKHPEKFAAKGIKPRVVALLEEGKDDAMFSMMLATIRR